MNQPDARGALLDVDGVLRIDEAPIPGAVAALARLRELGLPFRLLTNTTVRSRASLGALLRRMGFDVADDEIITAGVATAEYLRRHYPGRPVFPIVTGNVLDDFDGVPLSDGPDAGVVVIGGAEDNFTYAALNHAFRLLLDGARLVAMHRDPWWITAAGPTLDAGAFIRGLEHVTGARATVVGKPAAPFFRAGFRALGLPPARVVMVGDDLRQDVLPAMRLGATGALVRTGKFREADLAAGSPDIVLASVADLPAWLEHAGQGAVGRA
jgi:HAD superfamily hydrolase (TIGR01458 family)